jgi:hypothetical protein
MAKRRTLPTRMVRIYPQLCNFEDHIAEMTYRRPAFRPHGPLTIHTSQHGRTIRRTLRSLWRSLSHANLTSEHQETPTAIKFHPMAYDRRQSDARRVSASNIGPLTDLADAEAQDARRGFLQSLSERFEWNQQRRQGI